MKFTKEEEQELLQNPNVYSIVNGQIHYTEAFKEYAVQEYLQGKIARKIFEESGFNLDMISKNRDYASKILSKWRKKQNVNIHFPPKIIKENKTNYQKLLARNEYLEAENEFLKKLQALRQQFK